MSALETVRWRPLLAELAASLPDEGERLQWCLERNRARLLPPRSMALAVLTVAAGKANVGALVAKHGTETAARDAVAAWLYFASRVALRTLESPEPAVVPGPVRQGEVWVDPRLPALPLLHLAAEWAETSALPLVVRLAELGPVTGGRTMRETVVKVVLPLSLGAGIEDMKVDLVEISPSSADMATTWLHEFSHVIDDEHDANPCDTEPFADRLGELLALHRPARFAQVAPLMTQARQDIRSWPEMAGVPQRSEQALDPTPDVDLPKPGIESLLALAHLPLEREGAMS